MSETKQEYQKKKQSKKMRKSKKFRKELNSDNSFSSLKNQTRRSSYHLTTEQAKILEERTQNMRSIGSKDSLRSPVSSHLSDKQKENKEGLFLEQQPGIFSSPPSQPRIFLKNYEKRLTTVISRDLHSNPSTKYSSIKLQNFLHPPIESTTMLPTFGEGKSSIHSPGNIGENRSSLLFSPSHPRMNSDLLSSPTKTMLASSDRLGITSTHNIASIQAIEQMRRKSSSFKQSQLQQFTRERLRDLITSLNDPPISRQEQYEMDSSGFSQSFSGRGGRADSENRNSSPNRSQPKSLMHSPREKMQSMHKLFKIGKKCKLNMKRLRMDLLREEAQYDIVHRAQRIKAMIAKRADISDPEVREVVKSLDNERVLKKRKVGSFLYSDNSIEELKNNDSKRLASLGKIKTELFLYGAKCSLAISQKYRYRGFLPQA